MRLACARAVEIGLPGLAFTEHVDFTQWSQQDSAELARPSGTAVVPPARIAARPRVAPLDVEGYLADLARCREEFPDLRILSGIEAGEPHLFPASVAAVLAAGDFERAWQGSVKARDRHRIGNIAYLRAIRLHQRPSAGDAEHLPVVRLAKHPARNHRRDRRQQR